MLYVPEVIEPADIARVAPSAVTADPATGRVAILAYAGVAPCSARTEDGPTLTPDAFAEQLDYLRRAGYTGTTCREIAESAHLGTVERLVAITFYNEDRSFLEHALPLLRRFDFPATMFLATDLVGVSNATGSRQVLTWDDVRGAFEEGVQVGARGASGSVLTGMPAAEVTRDVLRAHAAITREVGVAPTAFAYPAGASDGVVRHLVGACGFDVGLTAARGHAALVGDQMAMPTIAIGARDNFADFVRKVADPIGG
jgi:peptidoglycan/xylan/chitin deacetylase (PgdA/CDA1 family)